MNLKYPLSLMLALCSIGLIYYGYVTLNLNEQSLSTDSIKVDKNIDNNTPPVVLPEKDSYTLNIEDDYTVYTDTELNYTIKFPKEDKFFRCKGNPCARISGKSLRLWAFEQKLSRSNIEKSILSLNLYCNNDDDLERTYCRDKEVVSFINSKDITAYKITETMFTTNKATNETVEKPRIHYLFPMTHPKYTAILITVDEPTSENLVYLETLVDTFNVN